MAGAHSYFKRKLAWRDALSSKRTLKLTSNRTAPRHAKNLLMRAREFEHIAVIGNDRDLRVAESLQLIAAHLSARQRRVAGEEIFRRTLMTSVSSLCRRFRRSTSY